MIGHRINVASRHGARRASKRRETQRQEIEESRVVARINELITTSRTSWLAFLSYLAFTGITLLAVQDADFFIPERRTELPLVGVSIPTFLFFKIGPALGLVLFTYMHLHLVKLWEAIGDISSAIDRGIDERTTPWLVFDMAVAMAGQIASGERSLSLLSNTSSVLLVFLAGPLLLAWFWWRSWPAHDETMTIVFCGLPLAISTFISLKSWSRMRASLSPRSSCFHFGSRQTALVSLVMLPALVLVGWFKTEGTLSQYARSYLGYHDRSISLAQGVSDPLEGRWWAVTPFPSFLASADLSGVSFVQVPVEWRDADTARRSFRARWCESRGIPALACSDSSNWARDPVTTSQQKWCSIVLASSTTLDADCVDLWATEERKFIDAWDVERKASLESLNRRSLMIQDFRSADLSSARLDAADLSQARLQGANLNGAFLEGAKLRNTLLDSARMNGATLRNADLVFAHLADVTLMASDLVGVDLRMATTLRADFRQSRMNDANLVGTVLQEANLTDVELSGADLREADLSYALLSGVKINKLTRLLPKSMEGAGLHRVDVSNVRGADLLSTAFGDASVILPEGLKAGEGSLAHWSSERLLPQEFQAAWMDWRMSASSP